MAISALYQKYLENNCNAEELQELLSHFEQSQNPELVLMIRHELEKQNPAYESLPMVESLVLRLDDFIDNNVIVKPRRLSIFHRKRFSYWAAAVLFLILSVSIYSIHSELNIFNHHTSEYKNDVAPGKNIAVLTLENGRKIELDESLPATLVAQSDILISKTGTGQLKYKVLGNRTGNDKNAFNIVSTPRGGKYEVELSDGTIVFLNAASSIRFPAAFDEKKSRRVELDGEAYFEVAHRSAQPFLVQSGNQIVKVLGTHFNVNAYKDEQAMKTTLLKGSVVVSDGKGTDLLLKPGQQSSLANGKLLLRDVNAEVAVDWKNGEMNINNEDFKTTMRKISRWYDVDVVFDENAPTELRLGGIISRTKSIITVLKVLELTGEVHFKVEGRRVTVMK